MSVHYSFHPNQYLNYFDFAEIWKIDGNFGVQVNFEG